VTACPTPLSADKGKYADDVRGALKATLQYALNALLRTDLINNKSSAVQTRLQDLTRQVGYLNGYRWVVNACGYLRGPGHVLLLPARHDLIY
jgi:hypothetical protein